MTGKEIGVEDIVGGAEPACPLVDVPPEHRRAAEEIRAHLVAVRGGGLFLSSADARVLVKWLDAGTSVVAIAAAIERAAEARRAKRSRVPLTLGRAAVHLGKAPYHAVRVATVVPASSHRLGVALAALAGAGERDLADELGRIDDEDPDELVRAVLARVRTFLHDRWEVLGADERDRRLASARADLEELELSEIETTRLAEEIVRDEIRKAWPMLDTAYLWGLAHGGPS